MVHISMALNMIPVTLKKIEYEAITMQNSWLSDVWFNIAELLLTLENAIFGSFLNGNLEKKIKFQLTLSVVS